MKWTPWLLALSALTGSLANEEEVAYQSDIARLLRVVVSHLYHHRDVFLRELISNSGDALEKLRYQSLTDPHVLDAAPDLNITLRAYDDPLEPKLVLTDSGVGMTREELQQNLGTIARSGTSEFLQKLEGSEGETGSNLIGQFGLGFYSSFLVADKVLVASKSNEDTTQWVFESRADAQSFKIREDERGNTLGRGTEITLFLKPDCKEYLETATLRDLIGRHSEFSTTAPIYIWGKTASSTDAEKSEPVEDLPLDGEGETTAEQATNVASEGWTRINDKPPLWMRDIKDVSDDDYKAFYAALTKDTSPPLFWSHFKGDAGTTGFRALIYVPTTVPHDFFSKSYQMYQAIKLYVRRVFITSDLGDDFMPRWLNFLKVVIDADDLPLNVGRDSLQSSKSIKQIQRSIVKKSIDLFSLIARTDESGWHDYLKKASNALKIGAYEDQKNRSRLLKLLRWPSNVDEHTSLDDYISRRKQGQKQLFFMAGTGLEKADVERSPFVEKIVARGYEVLYFLEPMDGMLASVMGTYEGLRFQDVAKRGLLFGDEDETSKEEEEELKARFEPLTSYLKTELDEGVSEVLISTRLTTSPCAIVADSYGWSGNEERLMQAQAASSTSEGNFMTDFMKKAKRLLEINPNHPLIEGLLDKVIDDSSDEDVRAIVKVLWDTALIRSGFYLKDTHSYFDRIEAMLRKNLGVSTSAQVRIDDVRPAPPIETGPTDANEVPSDRPPEGAFDNLEDWSVMRERLKQEQPSEPAVGHDEL